MSDAGAGADTDAYAVLGVPRGASLATVRAAYIRLAKIHHPDKLSSDANVKYHEECFKRISSAYKKITEGVGETTTGRATSDNVSVNMHEWLKNMLHQMSKVYHTIQLHVSLEEIHNNKTKKLELFLRDVNHAIYIKVQCGCFPKTTIVHEGKLITINFVLKPHNVYYLDDVLGTSDLFTTCTISWAEYITGTTSEILWCDGKTKITVKVPPFPDLDMPLIYPERGLRAKGDLYIKLHLISPSERDLNSDQKEKILEALNAYHTSSQDKTRE
jgi:DnaJ-class molecular chaperone